MDLDKVMIKTPRDKVIISELSLSVKRGEFLAILGPSGSGKTTLLDYLTGNFRGNLIYSGRRILHSDSKVKYVAQEDHLHGFYTVRQYFDHYITLNYGISPTKEQREKITNDIAAATGLSNLLDTRVGDILFKGLSGGQKRRLSIALELVSYPEVLILDEPTSGLDSYSALKIIEVLKNLTSQGICILATIHQPSSQIWNMLDRVLLLSSGKIIYEGKNEEAENFFASFGKVLPSSYNPADFYMQNINADFDASIDIKKISTLWQQYKEKGVKYIIPQQEKKEQQQQGQQPPEEKYKNNGEYSIQANKQNNQENIKKDHNQENKNTQNSTNNNALDTKSIQSQPVHINSPKQSVNIDANEPSNNDIHQSHVGPNGMLHNLGGDNSGPILQQESPVHTETDRIQAKVDDNALKTEQGTNRPILSSEQVNTAIKNESGNETPEVEIAVHQVKFDELFNGISRSSNAFERFLALCKRNLLNILKNPGILGVRVFMYAMLCFMIGAMFFNLGDDYDDEDINARANLLFFVNAFFVFMSIAALPFFMIERAIVNKEIINHIYEPFSYQAAAFLTNLPGIFIIALLSTMLVVLMGDLQNFGTFLLILFLALVIAENIAILFSLLVPHYIIGMALVAGSYGMFMLCQGYMIVKSKIPDYLIWGHYISFHTYSFKSFMHNEFNDITAFSSTQLPSGKHVLALYEMENVDIGENIGILVGYTMIIQVFIFAVMKMRFKKRHPKGNVATVEQDTK